MLLSAFQHLGTDASCHLPRSSDAFHEPDRLSCSAFAGMGSVYQLERAVTTAQHLQPVSSLPRGTCCLLLTVHTRQLTWIWHEAHTQWIILLFVQ